MTALQNHNKFFSLLNSRQAPSSWTHAAAVKNLRGRQNDLIKLTSTNNSMVFSPNNVITR